MVDGIHYSDVPHIKSKGRDSTGRRILHMLQGNFNNFVASATIQNSLNALKQCFKF